MNINKRHLRAWTTFPAIALIVAISVISGPAANAAYTTQVPLGAARPFAVLAEAAVTANVLIPVAVVTIPRLPSTSTNVAYEPLQPVNFVQGFALGFALVLIGGLLLLGMRRSV